MGQSMNAGGIILIVLGAISVVLALIWVINPSDGIDANEDEWTRLWKQEGR